MPSKRPLLSFTRTARPALAGLLATLVLALGLIAANGPLHRSLHHDGSSDTGQCVVCLFAHGQVNAPDAAPALVLGIFLLLGILLVASASRALSIDFRLPPERGPPCLSHAS